MKKNKIIFPEFIKHGDKIGVTACSDGEANAVDQIRMDHSISEWSKRGYQIVETANTRTSINGRSAAARERVEQLMQLINDDSIQAVIMAGGGDYLLEIIPLLDFSYFLKHPKWIQGYSDPTGLLYTMTVNCELATIYASNFIEFGMKQWHTSLEQNLNILEGQGLAGGTGYLQKGFEFFTDGFVKKINGLEGYLDEKEVVWQVADEDTKKSVSFEGRLLGGCLDVLTGLVGTKYDKTCEFAEKYKEDGILWYLESFSMGSTALFTSLWNLREAGWFSYVKGFIFGRPAFFEAFDGSSYEEIVMSVLGEFGVPIVLNADIGHKPPRITVINGAYGKAYIENGKGCLEQYII